MFGPFLVWSGSIALLSDLGVRLGAFELDIWKSHLRLFTSICCLYVIG